MNEQVQTRIQTDVLVVGDGLAGVAAALAAVESGRKVTLAAAGTAVGEELTVSMCGESASGDDPTWRAIVERIDAMGGRQGDWLDPATGELAIDALLRDRGVHVLLYAVPVALVDKPDDSEAAAGVIMAGKDGAYIIAAGVVVDATAGGVLAQQAGATFDRPERIAGRRRIFFQFADEGDVPADLGEVEGFTLTVRRTWSNEVCVILRGEAEDDGGPIPHVLEFRSRLAVEPIAQHAIAALEVLNEVAVSHTSHRMLPVTGPRMRDGELAKRNVIPAGPWVSGESWGDLHGMVGEGAAAGREAMARIEAVEAITAVAPDVRESECEVMVVGGGTGGAISAIAAARQGAETTLIEASPVLGGIGTGGGIHFYYHGVRGGVQDEIDAETRRVTDALGGPQRVHGFSPEAKKIALLKAAVEAGVTVCFDTTVVDVVMEGNRLAGVTAAAPGRLTVHRAKTTVDASGDGDIAARAGAEFIMGREGDGVSHAYSQVAGRLVNERSGHANFDAGFVDATDVLDLTRARRDGLEHLRRERPFTAEDRWTWVAPILGLRQSRQVICEYMLTLDDQVQQRNFDDVIAYGKCHYDNHARDYENESDEAMFWCWVLGFWREHMRHGVPYRSIVPGEVDGLLIGCRALGVTHDASMLFRMQRDMQRIGEAAGRAAAIAARRDVPPRRVPVDELQAALRESGAMKDSWPSGPPEDAPEKTLAEWDGPHGTVASWLMYRRGDDAVEPLLNILQEGGEHARWHAACTLAMLDRQEAAPVLLDALQTRDETLPAPPEKAGDPPWIRKLFTPRWMTAMPLLGRLQHQPAVPALIDVIEGPIEHPDAHLAAVRALARIGDPAAVEPLRRLVQRDDLPGPMRREGIADGVEIDTTWKLPLAVADALRQLGEPDPEITEAYLDHPHGHVRRYARRIHGAAATAV